MSLGFATRGLFGSGGGGASVVKVSSIVGVIQTSSIVGIIRQARIIGIIREGS